MGFSVKNQGQLDVDQVQFHLFTEDGTLNVTDMIPVSDLAIGTEKRLTVHLPLPSVLQRQELRLEVQPVVSNTVDPDLTPDNNKASILLAGSDLVVDSVSIPTLLSGGAEESYLVQATVTNSGLSTSQNSLVILLSGGIDGTVPASSEVGDLAVGESTVLLFTLNLEGSSRMLANPSVTVEALDENDLYTGNNFVLISIPRADSDLQLRLTSVNGSGSSVQINAELTSDSITKTDGSLYAAVYNGSGRQIGLSMLENITVNTDGTTTQKELTSKLAEPWNEQCTVTLFFLNSKTGTPLTNAVTYPKV